MNDDTIKGKTTTTSHWKSVTIFDGKNNSVYTYDKELINELRNGDGKSATDIWNNEMLPLLTDDDSKAQGEAIRIAAIDPSDIDAHKKAPGYTQATGFYSLDHQKNVRQKLKENLYATVFSSTKGAARQIIEGKGVEKIEEARTALIARFGKSQPTNVKDNEKNFTGGTPEGREMHEQDDPRVYLQSMESLQQTLIEGCSNEKLAEYAPGKPDALLKNVSNGLAANFTSCLSLHSQWSRMTDELSESIPENETLKAKTQPEAKYEELKKMLNEHYESLMRQQKNSNRGADVPVLAFRVGDDKRSKSGYSKLNNSDNMCFDCGEYGHMIGDPQCTEPTAMKAYPEHWRKVPAGRAVQLLNQRRGNVTNDNGNKLCHFYASGNCNQGESCRFIHDGTPTPETICKKSEINKTEKLMVAVLQRQQERKKANEQKATQMYSDDANLNAFITSALER